MKKEPDYDPLIISFLAYTVKVALGKKTYPWMPLDEPERCRKFIKTPLFKKLCTCVEVDKEYIMRKIKERELKKPFDKIKT